MQVDKNVWRGVLYALIPSTILWALIIGAVLVSPTARSIVSLGVL